MERKENFSEDFNQMEDVNFEELFNFTPEDFVQQERQRNSELYSPTPEKGKEGSYKSVIRFLPWWGGKEYNYISKWVVWVKDPVTGAARYVDCPSSIGEKSILASTYYTLVKSESIADQKLAREFLSRKKTFYSLVQIIKDDNDPDLVGKIMVFKYGVKIFNKIMAEVNPEIGKPHIPFDLYTGKPLFLVVNKVGGYNNYDNSKFLDEPMPLKINGKPIEKSNEGLKKAYMYLKENSPNLLKYTYKPWDEDTENFINSVLQNLFPDGRIIGNILNKSNNSTNKTDSKIHNSTDDISKLNISNKKTSSILDDVNADLDDINIDMGNIFDDTDNDIDDIYSDL